MTSSNRSSIKRFFSRRSWLLAAGAALACQAGSGWAQSPNPTVKLIVGYAAGGPVDASARVFAPVLSRELGQPVIVENRPGAGGALAGNSVVKAAPNGLELFFAASPTMTISPHVLKAWPGTRASSCAWPRRLCILNPRRSFLPRIEIRKKARSRWRIQGSI